MEAPESSSTQMHPRRSPAPDRQQDGPGRAGEVAAVLPLAILESVRAHDRPEEVLEDENLTASLPRRLGLSDVIHSQIRRYEEARRKGRPVPARELEDLIKLVIRRPDAEEVLDESGRGVVFRYLEGFGDRRARFARLMPRPLARRAFMRRASMLARRIAAGAEPSVLGGPLRVSLSRSITAEVDPGGVACSLYGAAFRALGERYLKTELRVEHTRCEARGDEVCEWTVHE